MKRGKIVIISIIAIIIIALIGKNINDSRSLDNNGVYVIGKVDKLDGAKQGVRVYVSYNYKGKTFKSDYIDTDFNRKKIELNKKYIFLVDSSDPTKFHIEYGILVPDSLSQSPYNGWDSLPFKRKG